MNEEEDNVDRVVRDENEPAGENVQIERMETVNEQAIAEVHESDNEGIEWGWDAQSENGKYPNSTHTSGRRRPDLQNSIGMMSLRERLLIGKISPRHRHLIANAFRCYGSTGDHVNWGYARACR
ncbi:hypothetical protein M9458_051355 [Cirrhinus mrigala]|uniref:Uncharacterized protein n=1 Tax=Cirrhinus mrigala TaxID=683832 RepID=A0ABD0MTK7_CIRMR